MMRDHQVRIESGDCLSKLALLPERSVDHVITDPPYSAWVHERSRVPVSRTSQRSQRRTVSRRELGFESMTQELRVAVARQWARLVRRWVLVFTDCESSHLWREALTGAGLEYVRMCYWHKLRATPQLTVTAPPITSSTSSPLGNQASLPATRCSRSSLAIANTPTASRCESAGTEAAAGTSTAFQLSKVARPSGASTRRRSRSP